MLTLISDSRRWDSCFKELENSSDIHRLKTSPSSEKPRGRSLTHSRLPPKFEKTYPIKIGSEIRQVPELSDELESYSSKKRGMGGFGVIFKGRLRDGTRVAIKVFKSNSTQVHLPPIQMASKRVCFLFVMIISLFTNKTDAAKCWKFFLVEVC